MHDLLKTLTQDQVLWFAKLIVAVINIDENISINENEILPSIFSYIKNGDDRKELVKLLEADEIPPLTMEKGLTDHNLAATFVELIHVVITDTICNEKEIDLLYKVADMFHFSKGYQKQLIAWCEEGVTWKNTSKEFLPDRIWGEYIHVPIYKLTEDQKVWYGEALLGAILAEGFIDTMEVDLLEWVISALESSYEKKRLYAMSKQRKSPLLQPPPLINIEVIMRMYMQILSVVMVNDILTKQEIKYLKLLAKVCKLPQDFFDQSIAWCKQGIIWKRKQIILVEHCSFS